MVYNCLLPQDILNLVGEFANYQLNIINYKKKYEIRDLYIKKLSHIPDIVFIVHDLQIASINQIQRAYEFLFNNTISYSSIYRTLDSLIFNSHLSFFQSSSDKKFYFFCPCVLNC